MPTASTAAPTNRRPGRRNDAVISSPARSPSDAAASRSGGARSGSRREHDPAGDHHDPVAAERGAPQVQADLGGVQRREGEEARHRGDAGEQPEPGHQGRTVDQRAGGADRPPGRGSRARVRRAPPRRTSSRRRRPDQSEPAEVEQRLPDDRPGRDPGEQGERVVAQRLAGAAGGARSARAANPATKYSASAMPISSRSASSQIRSRRGDGPGPARRRARPRRSSRWSAAVAVGPPAGQGAEDQGADAERAEGEPTAAGPARAARDEERRHPDQRAARREVREVGQGQRHERWVNSGSVERRMRAHATRDAEGRPRQRPSRSAISVTFGTRWRWIRGRVDGRPADRWETGRR